MESQFEKDKRLTQIFMPHAYGEMERVRNSPLSFVHYTSAEAALSIIENREIWMRKASCMIDFSEVTYGMNLVEDACRSDVGKRLDALLDRMFSGFRDNFNPIYARIAPFFEEDTYLACVSEHDVEHENDIGRLSMWRAFGAGTRVALVFKKDAFFSTSNVLQVFASPVAYLGPAKFQAGFEAMVASMEANFEYVQALGLEDTTSRLLSAFWFAALCTKHPGFHEEREWRCVYSPRLLPSDRIKEGRHVFDGAPQPIYKIPLENVPERGLFIAVPDLLQRVIVGPTPYPRAVFETFETALRRVGVPNAATLIKVSNIPIRT